MQVKDALTLTLFAGTGDLTHRKLIPALYASYVSGLLPAEFAMVGVRKIRSLRIFLHLWL